MIAAGTVLAALGGFSPSILGDETGTAAPAASVRASSLHLLASHCVACHGPDDVNGGFRIDTLAAAIDSVEVAERWQQVLDVLNAGEMPPKDEKQLDPAAKTELLDDLAHSLAVARKALADTGGAITMRRLNRREYVNTIRDLLGVEIDARALPADAQAGSFDTMGSSLFISADQIEQYHELGQAAIRDAWLRYDAGVKSQKIHAEAETITTPKVRKNMADRIDAHGRFTAWKNAVEAAARKPENQEAVAAIQKESRNHPDALIHGWERLQGAPSPVDSGFVDSINAEQQGQRNWRLGAPYHALYLSMPGIDTGAYLSINDVRIHPYHSFRIPGNWPPGDYVLRLRLAHTDEAPPQRRFIEYGRRYREHYTPEGCRQVTGTMAEPQILEIPISITSESYREIWFYERGVAHAGGNAYRAFFDAYKKNGVGPPLAIWIDWVEAEGPLDDGRPAAIAELLAATGEENAAEADIQGVLERFATRAFRGRSPEPAYLDHLVASFRRHRDAGESFRAALGEPLAVVLASPHFLYLSEPVPETARRQLDGLQLASRLSYFLWSGPPDELLIEAARRGDLATSEGRGAQIDRMLADPRSRRFVEDFTHQWLGLDRLDFFQFNGELYPRYDLTTKALSRQEIFETVGLLIAEDLSLKNLLSSDFVVVNGALASFYGLDGVRGDEFRSVKLPDGSPRGGLLGMAAVHAMGSNGEHTSPVERGAWVLRKLLHDPPPPAPPNVPQLTRLDGELLTTRERLRLHQEEPQCASCHRRIDPIGFGLENFDAVGIWRTTDSYEKKGAGRKEWAIDPAGAFHSGPAFKDFFELREIITAEHEAFATGFAESLLEFALGRPCGFSDEALIKTIVGQAAARDYSVRQFIHALVHSDAFGTK
jgi:hypothetical protein